MSKEDYQTALHPVVRIKVGSSRSENAELSSQPFILPLRKDFAYAAIFSGGKHYFIKVVERIVAECLQHCADIVHYNINRSKMQAEFEKNRDYGEEIAKINNFETNF